MTKIKQEEERQANLAAPLAMVGQLVEVGGKFLRLAKDAPIPEGGVSYDVPRLETLDPTALGQIYGQLAGVHPKMFRTQRLAIESILYQVGRVNPSVTAESTAPDKAKTERASGLPKKSPGRTKREPGTLTVKIPDDAAAKLGGMAPQARELVTLLSEYSQARKSLVFGEADFLSFVNQHAERLRTKQLPERIFQYYRKALVSAGFLVA